MTGKSDQYPLCIPIADLAHQERCHVRAPHNILAPLLCLSKIYHNPNCGTSRNTLEMIRQSGEMPEVIEYLQFPPSRIELVWLLQ